MSFDTAVVARDPLSPVEAVLRKATRLWAATNLHGVILAAQVLLDELTSGARVRRCARGAAPGASDDATGLFRIDLTDDEVLLVTVPIGPDTGASRIGVEAIRARIHAFTERTAVNESIVRPGHAERLQRAQRTRALAVANRDLRVQIDERERVEGQLKHQALHDTLTGLPNRTLLVEQLQAALERFHSDTAQGFAVLFIDLDRFKIVNDSVGHLTGDDMLFQAGSRLRACVKPEDVVARLGGDEFGVLLDRIQEPHTARRVAERIIDAFNAPFRIGAKDLFTSASVGIVLSAGHYQHPEELLRDADSAMYRAKAEGRHRCRIFDDGLRREALSLLEIENDLRQAHTQAEFVPYYQPIVELASGRVVGYEALMRWRHPRRGVLLPAEFLGVADDNGIAEAIDWQIFEQVCRDVPALLGNGNAFVAINLSARHFRDPELDRRLLGMLAAHDVRSTSLRIEVTEHAMLENPPEANRILQTLRGAGVAMSLDDFGTGYSSLSYLHQYPVQTIKIDRSFVMSLSSDSEHGSEVIIRTIIAMAKHLSTQVIAEGVETMDQRNQLMHMGCRYAQGFLYGHACPLQEWQRKPGTPSAQDAADTFIQPEQPTI